MGRNSSHLKWGSFALFINLWAELQISGVDGCTGASPETSYSSDSLTLAVKTAVIVEAVAPESKNPALPGSPWAVLLSSTAEARSNRIHFCYMHTHQELF